MSFVIHSCRQTRKHLSPVLSIADVLKIPFASSRLVTLDVVRSFACSGVFQTVQLSSGGLESVLALLCSRVRICQRSSLEVYLSSMSQNSITLEVAALNSVSISLKTLRSRSLCTALSNLPHLPSSMTTSWVGGESLNGMRYGLSRQWNLSVIAECVVSQ